jgi:hypothetical protein
MDTADLSSIMISRFRRHGRGPVANATGPVGKLAQEVSQMLLARVELWPSEVPVLASACSCGDWVLITSLRVWISHQGTIAALEFGEIEDVSCDCETSVKHDQSETLDLEYISLSTFFGKRLTLHVQPGGGYLGMISVLKMLADRNWRRREERGRKRGNKGVESL